MTTSNPAPQRALRAHRPPRPGDRTAVSPDHLAELSHRLTARDRWLAHLLLEHRVLTSTQIVQLGFGVPRTANLRLAKLYQWRVIDRFQPYAQHGASPMHYVLDLAGAHILAAGWGLTPDDLGYRHDRALGIGHSLHLAHAVATSGIYTALVAIARHSGQHSGEHAQASRRVTAWWSESRCARYFGAHVRPDGYGRWHEAGSSGSSDVEFFLEYDFGTEPLAKVAGKLADYHRLAHATELVTPVLFWFPSHEREDNGRAVLATALADLGAPPGHPDGLVPVATTSSLPPDPSIPANRAAASAAVPDSPAGPRWLPLIPAAVALARMRPSAGRLRLAQLGGVWPTRGRPVVAANGLPDAAAIAAPAGRTGPARSGRSSTPAAGSWPAPAAMPPDPNRRDASRGPSVAA
ncbi:MAG TPA: replication-relaxation family protein [Jatrophihabitans sp.]|nr:replication-relaxation family protein [Jatrophihabitans sp.]